MRIDLHTHSRVSDGTSSPAELMHEAASAGVDVVALTDHDSTAGWTEASAAVGAAQVALVRGAEISCTAGGISVHLLSYLHDPEDGPLSAVLDASRASRDGRAQAMVARLAEDLDLTWADVQAQAGDGATIGRPHLADALVAKGYVADRAEAFASLLSPAGKYYVRYGAPAAVDAVRLVRAAGGVPVFAHPRASARGRIVEEPVIREMASAGLAGLEVDHRDHTEADREHLRVLAAELGLFVTGSSDYHGSGKPNRLGEHTSSAEVLQVIEAEGHLEVVYP
ncbi:PHP domain-containing protein [Ruania halotolerans]|uniref:PHP domain-containing protein n=1 Tax=Ruania halotolerans TaxID=2897773 RepID=UPI001E5A5EEE|nr:PHP domain-containing protein [Ruania halotolerans]UFU05574.1 PHP domain-containing protein [Ruania halotolerans]